ncbi:hypothetical protein NPIL_412121 [Nephila pilipes]|uniref:Uncharacterized protein n=1 Tax=Nephila pilipes TaxID=299642 RepID=A0A8X6TSP5_NEPPI|nr:hypothetical protein NPIL_412121 [Nephila pilipes]
MLRRCYLPFRSKDLHLKNFRKARKYGQKAFHLPPPSPAHEPVGETLGRRPHAFRGLPAKKFKMYPIKYITLGSNMAVYPAPPDRASLAPPEPQIVLNEYFFLPVLTHTESVLIQPTLQKTFLAPNPVLLEKVFSAVKTMFFTSVFSASETVFSAPLPKPVFPASETEFSILETRLSEQEYNVPPSDKIFLNTLLNSRNKAQIVQTVTSILSLDVNILSDALPRSFWSHNFLTNNGSSFLQAPIVLERERYSMKFIYHPLIGFYILRGVVQSGNIHDNSKRLSRPFLSRETFKGVEVEWPGNLIR